MTRKLRSMTTYNGTIWTVRRKGGRWEARRGPPRRGRAVFDDWQYGDSLIKAIRGLGTVTGQKIDWLTDEDDDAGPRPGDNTVLGR